MKYRWEYRFDTQGHRTWILFIEGVDERWAFDTYFQALEALGPEHPCIDMVDHIFRNTVDGLEVVPYEPVAVSQDTLEALGAMFVNRVEESEEEMKVWFLKNGNAWLHVPGDSGR